ncbi:unnamed protein product, partial [Polarella glacialis]
DAGDPEFSRALAKQVTPQIRDFELEELLMVSWGAAGSCASDVDLFNAIQDEVAGRLREFEPRNFHDLASLQKFVQDILGVVWACNYANILSQPLLESAREAMKQTGVEMDKARGTSCSYQVPSLLETSIDSLLLKGQPQIVLDLPDRFVILKPPGWEVADQHTELQLLFFVRAVLGGQLPILFDAEHTYGFLHRLDVPSSGLILAAKTYEAYYDLQVQLSAGEVTRDYVVLCHGWARPGIEGLAEINARVSWRNSDLSASGGQGKPSRTLLKITAHAAHQAEALSLAAVRIATGRRHQIRSHLSHVGHPTVCDGKYTASATFQSDSYVCERNFLHRCRLVFRDANCVRREVTMPLPADLRRCLQKVASKERVSQGALQLWLGDLGPFDWEECNALKK